MKDEKSGGLDVEFVNGAAQTDAIEFPEAFINHTVLSAPHNHPKILDFDCDQVKIKYYSEGVVVIIITKTGEDGKKVTTEIIFSPKTECVLSRSVSGSD